MTDFDASLYGEPTVEFISYRKNEMTTLENYAKHNPNIDFMVDQGNKFDDTYISDEAISHVRDIHTKAGQSLGLDIITRLDEVHRAMPVMQGYIMSNPKIYKQYTKGNIDGFEATLKLDKKLDIKHSSNYLKAVNGIVNKHTGNGSITYISKDKSLTYLQQSAIYDSWDKALDMLADGEDPTEPM